MSVFGGDSWAREAQHRKRRVDDLIIQGIDSSAYKKLPSGKFLCLICPHRPVLDTPLTLSAHQKGSRHRVAEAKLKERELSRENEMNKRIAMGDSSATSTTGSTPYRQRCAFIDQAQKAGSITCHYEENTSTQKSSIVEAVKAPEEVLDHQFDSRDRREKELKFTAAGWKRDGYGRWFKDENVSSYMRDEKPTKITQMCCLVSAFAENLL